MLSVNTLAAYMWTEPRPGGDYTVGIVQAQAQIIQKYHLTLLLGARSSVCNMETLTPLILIFKLPPKRGVTFTQKLYKGSI